MSIVIAMLFIDSGFVVAFGCGLARAPTVLSGWLAVLTDVNCLPVVFVHLGLQ